MQKQNENKMLLSLTCMLLALGSLITVFFPSLKYSVEEESIRAFGLETTFGASMNRPYHFNVLAFILFLIMAFSVVLNYILLNNYEKKIYIALLVIYALIAVLQLLTPVFFKLANPDLNASNISLAFGPILALILNLFNVFAIAFCLYKIKRGEY